MEKSKLVLMSDDDMSANSKLEVKVCDKLDTVDFEHTKLTGFGICKYSLHLSQVKKLIKYLQQAEEYISSNHNPVLAPDGFTEFKEDDND